MTQLQRKQCMRTESMVNMYLWGARDISVDSRRALMVHLNIIWGASVKHAWGIPGAPIVCSKCICGAPVRLFWRIRSTCEWNRGASIVHSNNIRCASNVASLVLPLYIHEESMVHLWCILCALVENLLWTYVALQIFRKSTVKNHLYLFFQYHVHRYLWI